MQFCGIPAYLLIIEAFVNLLILLLTAGIIALSPVVARLLTLLFAQRSDTNLSIPPRSQDPEIEMLELLESERSRFRMRLA